MSERDGKLVNGINGGGLDFSTTTIDNYAGQEMFGGIWHVMKWIYSSKMS